MLALALQAELIGVTNLKPADTLEQPHYYTFKVQCTSCRETHPNWIGMSCHDSHEVTGSKGEANFVWRCKSCKRESTATIKGPAKAYDSATSRKPCNILEFDCRGLELLEFQADGEWTAEGAESSTQFTGIDLSEGEWFDYDEKLGMEVSIKEIKWIIRRA